ncbi:MAG: GHKL domain-containing protein [Bacteroidia bacterium]
MVYKRFNINVIVRLLILVGALSALVYVLIIKSWLITSGICAFLVVVLVVELFNFISKTNKDLSKFIDAINYQDYSVNFSAYKLGNAFEELHESFKSTLELFRNLRLEKEAHYQYLLRLVKHIDIGIIAINDQQKVVLYNESAQDLLGVPNLVDWGRYEEKVPQLFNSVVNKKTDARQLIKLSQGKELSLRSSRFLVDGQPHYVVVFQNIKAEIENKEMDAWNQLIKILTHEIMNSVTPISSLSDTLLTIEKIQEEPNDDIVEGLQTISRRSRILLGFVDDYRKLAHIPTPNKRTVNSKAFFTQVADLHKSRVKELGIDFNVKLANNIQLALDESLIFQVFDNLFSNASHALQNHENPEISITQKEVDKSGKRHLETSFRDNGYGVSENEIGQIFIPFFSTKAKGSGIGLSLSRQIIQMHNGQMRVESKKGEFFNVIFSLPL